MAFPNFIIAPNVVTVLVALCSPTRSNHGVRRRRHDAQQSQTLHQTASFDPGGSRALNRSISSILLSQQIVVLKDSTPVRPSTTKESSRGKSGLSKLLLRDRWILFAITYLPNQHSISLSLSSTSIASIHTFSLTLFPSPKCIQSITRFPFCQILSTVRSKISSLQAADNSLLSRRS